MISPHVRNEDCGTENYAGGRLVAGKMSVSFVVPCYNEEQTVAATVQSIRAAVRTDRNYEIILVDDCSCDGTLERMRQLAEDDPNIRVIHNDINLNFGGAYKRGAAVASSSYTMMLPGDDGFPSESIVEIMRHAGEADIIIPIILNPGVRAWHRAIASKGFTTLLNWLFWMEVGYYNGAVLQRTDLLRTIEIKTNSFAYQAEAIVKLVARGATYTHCYVRIKDREAGQSSALSLRNQIAVWKTLFHLIASVGLLRKVRIG